MNILRRKSQKQTNDKLNTQNHNSASKNSASKNSASKNSLSNSPNSKNSVGEFKFNDSDDIFDLTKLVSMENEEQVKIEKNLINDDDRVKLLQNYIEVLQDDWEKMPKNTHIRYLRNDGLFRRGGFVKNFWVTSYGNYKGKKCIQLSSSIDYKSKKWTVPLTDINKIWKKNNLQQSNLSDNITDTEMSKRVAEAEHKLEKNTENIEYLLQSTEQLKISLKQTQNDQLRIMNLIKQMHKKIQSR
jgi:hypothetical protein